MEESRYYPNFANIRCLAHFNKTASTFYAAFGVAYAQVDALIASALVAANASTGAAAGAFAFLRLYAPAYYCGGVCGSHRHNVDSGFIEMG